MKDTLPTGYVITDWGIKRASAYSLDDSLPSSVQVEICAKWIEAFAKPAGLFMDNTYSYSLKHKVEAWANEYVTNGAFITAASARGYKIRPLHFGPNAIFKMKLCLPGDEWKQVRPIGFSRWLFRQCDRHDPIGHLALDASQDESWLRRERSFIQFWMYLQRVDAIEKCTDALVGAWREFSGAMPPVPDLSIQRKCEGFYAGEGPVLKPGDSYRIAPSGMVYVYVLFEDETDKLPRRVRYVGRTKNPPQRLRLHLTQPGTREKLLWVADLVKAECHPLMCIIDLVNETDAARVEKAYIYAFDECERGFGQALGQGLLNKLL